MSDKNDNKEIKDALIKRIEEMTLLEPSVLNSAIKIWAEKYNMTLSSAVQDMILESYWNKYKKHMDESIKEQYDAIERFRKQFTYEVGCTI